MGAAAKRNPDLRLTTRRPSGQNNPLLFNPALQAAVVYLADRNSGLQGQMGSRAGRLTQAQAERDDIELMVNGIGCREGPASYQQIFYRAFWYHGAVRDMQDGMTGGNLAIIVIGENGYSILEDLIGFQVMRCQNVFTDDAPPALGA